MKKYILSMFVSLAFILLSATSYATVIEVNTLEFNSSTPDKCGLGDAIEASNENINVAGCIAGDDSVDEIHITVPGEINTTDFMPLYSNLKIYGHKNGTTLNADNEYFEGFDISNGFGDNINFPVVNYDVEVIEINDISMRNYNKAIGIRGLVETLDNKMFDIKLNNLHIFNSDNYGRLEEPVIQFDKKANNKVRVYLNNSIIEDHTKNDYEDYGGKWVIRPSIIEIDECYTDVMIMMTFYINNSIIRNNKTENSIIHNRCGHLVINDSTITNNTSQSIILANTEGVIEHTQEPYYQLNILETAPTLTDISNTTFFGNSANSIITTKEFDRHQYGIGSQDGVPEELKLTPEINIKNSTFLEDSLVPYTPEATPEDPNPVTIEPSIISTLRADMNIENSVLSSSATNGQNCRFGPGTINGIHNASNDESCGFEFDNSTNFNFGPLADNGGKAPLGPNGIMGNILTLAINDTSTLNNTGDNETCTPADARGITRPQNENCDIGAYEHNFAIQDTPPSIEVEDKTIQVNTELSLRDLIKSAIDEEDGDLQNEVEIIDDGGFDNTKPGIYSVKYALTDSDDNTAEATAVVTVVAPPILEVQDKTIQVKTELSLTELIQNASDAEDGDLQNEVEIIDDGGFDNTKPGIYSVKYAVTDSDDNTAEATAVVTVVTPESSNNTSSGTTFKPSDHNTSDGHKEYKKEETEVEEEPKKEYNLVKDTRPVEKKEIKEDKKPTKKEIKEDKKPTKKEIKKDNTKKEKSTPKPIVTPKKNQTLIKQYPKMLPQAGLGTDIYNKVGIFRNNKVVTKLQEDDFRLAGSTNPELIHWLQVLPEEDRDGDRYIVIPKKGVVMPLGDVQAEDEAYTNFINGKTEHFWKYLEKGAVELPGTTANGYGKVGNKVVTGHSSFWKNAPGNYKTQFQHIININMNDEIWIYERDETGKMQRNIYKAFASYETSAFDTAVLKPTDHSQLTLLTCTPIGGITGRWVVKAKFAGIGEL